MNKTVYLEQLSQALKKLPESEREDALQYYIEYFQDSTEPEEVIIQGLGSPQRVANSILAEFNMTKIDTIKSPTKKGASAIGTILLLVFAAPIALPLAIVLAAAVIVLAISVLLVVVSFGIAGVAMVLGGLILAVSALTIVTVHAPTAILSLALGVSALGAGVLLCMFMFYLGKKFINALVSSVKKRVERRGSK